MKKIIVCELIFTLLLAGLLVLLLSKRELKDVETEAFRTAFLKSPSSDGMEEWDALRLRRDFSLEEADYQGFVLYGEPDTMSVRIFLVVKCKEEAQTETVHKAFDRYLAAQKEAFEGYGASQMKLLNKAEIYEAGVYAALVIAEDPEDWIRLITELTEG